MVEGERKYVDVNVFVYWLTGEKKYLNRAKKWIEEIELRRGKFYTSVLTIYEVMVIIAGLTGRNLKDNELIETILKALTSLPGLNFVNLEEKDFEKAIELMDKHHLDLEDALHLASALKVGAKTIITNDEDFERADIKRVF